MSKPGYLYVLRHQSDPYLVKIGKTVQTPERRLAQHNSDFSKVAGQIVKKTGQKWTLEEVIEVPDTSFAEAVFWEVAHPHPFRGKIEVTRMGDARLKMGLDAARTAGVRPFRKLLNKQIRNRGWMIKRLEGSSLTLIGHYRGLQTGVEFECSKGHIFKASPGLVANRKYCPYCEGEWYTSYKL